MHIMNIENNINAIFRLYHCYEDKISGGDSTLYCGMEMDLKLCLIADSISKGEFNKADRLIDDALKEGRDFDQIMKMAIEPSIKSLEEGFKSGTVYLPTMTASTLFICKQMEKNNYESKNVKKTVVIGTGDGDIHEIGKNMCSMILKIRGYNVIDLGTNISAKKFMDVALKNKANAIAVSASMTTTRVTQSEIVNKSNQLEDKIYIFVGGASCSESWNKTIHADGYSKDWLEFAKLVNDKIGE